MPPQQRLRLSRIGNHTSATIGSDVTTLTPPTNAVGILVQLETDNVRYTIDGTTPVAGTTGFILYKENPPLLIDIGQNVTLKMTRVTADATLQYQWVEALG